MEGAQLDTGVQIPRLRRANSIVTNATLKRFLQMRWRGIKKSPQKTPRTFTTGVLRALKIVLTNSAAVRQAGICNVDMVHCSNDFADLTWGCGYRNIQQILSSLLLHSPNEYEAAFKVSRILTVSEIQSGIEEAWKNHFDVEGAHQLKWKLQGTRKWIGTTEAYAFLNYFGFDARLVQFEGTKRAINVLQFCKKYFHLTCNLNSEARIFVTNAHPLYFQHSGHSRTIVGYVEDKKGDRLLVFDPARRISRELKRLIEGMSTQKNDHILPGEFKRRVYNWDRILESFAIHDLHHKQYQILQLGDRILDSRERLSRQKIKACLI